MKMIDICASLAYLKDKHYIEEKFRKETKMKRQKILSICEVILLAGALALGSCGKKGATTGDSGAAQGSAVEQGSKSARELGQSEPVEEQEPIITVKELALQAPEFNFMKETGTEENPQNRMAHNIYSDPDLSETSGKFSAFSIDFLAEDSEKGSYWALCNWAMDLTSLREKYEVTNGGGAYAGLQNTIDGQRAIMSFWEIHYNDENGNDTILNAHRVYPNAKDNYFGGEGEGTNYIGPYDWVVGKWYRMLLRCVTGDNGNTFVEQWVMDIEKEKWTKISSFDTGLTDSCFIGGMSQFLENYDPSTSTAFRSFRIKNIYVKQKDAQEWTQILKSRLSTDIWWDNKKGNFAYGSDGNVFWGITCGYGTDVLKLEEHGPTDGIFEIAAEENSIAPTDMPEE